jgi:hypothetical protein
VQDVSTVWAVSSAALYRFEAGARTGQLRLLGATWSTTAGYPVAPPAGSGALRYLVGRAEGPSSYVVYLVTDPDAASGQGALLRHVAGSASMAVVGQSGAGKLLRGIYLAPCDPAINGPCASFSPSPFPTPSTSPTPSNTPSPTASPSATPTPTVSTSRSRTSSPSVSGSVSSTPSASSSPTATLSSGISATSTASNTPTPSGTPSNTPFKFSRSSIVVRARRAVGGWWLGLAATAPAASSSSECATPSQRMLLPSTPSRPSCATRPQVLRLGDGSFAPTTSVAMPLFLDEYEPATGAAALTRTVALPAAAGNASCTGTLVGPLNEGGGSLAWAGTHILLPCSPYPAGSISVFSTAYPFRGSARVGAGSDVKLTRYTDSGTAQSRGVVSVDGATAQLWVTGSSIRYVAMDPDIEASPPGAQYVSPNTPNIVSMGSASARHATVVSDAPDSPLVLVSFSATASTHGLYAVGTPGPLSNRSSQAFTQLLNGSAFGMGSFVGHHVVDVNNLFAASAGALWKFTAAPRGAGALRFSTATWGVAPGYPVAQTVVGGALRYITGRPEGGGYAVYATTDIDAGGTGFTHLLRHVEGTGEWVVLAASGFGRYFRGVYLPPCQEAVNGPCGALSPSPFPTPSASGTPTGSASGTRAPTPSPTSSTSPPPSGTPTGSGTPSPSGTGTPSRSETGTRTPSRSGTGSPSPSSTGSVSATASETASVSGSQTGTPSPSATETGTPSASGTQTGTPSASGTASPSSTGTGSGTAAATASGTAAPSRSRTAAATQSASKSRLPSASRTRSRSATATRTRSATRTKTRTKTKTKTKTRTKTPSKKKLLA